MLSAFGGRERNTGVGASSRKCPDWAVYLQAGVPGGQHAAIGGPLDPGQVLRVRVKVLAEAGGGRDEIENVFNRYTNVYFITDVLTFSI